MVADTVRISRTPEGLEQLEASAWPRSICIGELDALDYARGPDLLDFRLANARGIYRIRDFGEDGILSAELVYEEWYPRAG